MSRLPVHASSMTKANPTAPPTLSRPSLTLCSDELGEEFAEALQAFRQLRRRTGVADAQRFGLAEGRAGHAGHALGLQQHVAEVDVVGDLRAVMPLAEGAGDVREHVERALRARALHAGDGVERCQHLIALGL